MDPFITYLISVNLLALVAGAIDLIICRRRPEHEDSTAHNLIMGIFPIAGGALGMLLALFVLTGLAGGRRMNKGNVAWWFLAIVCLIAWGMVVAARLGLVALDVSLDRVALGWDLERIKVVGICLAAINVATFAAFAWDKHVAASGNDYGRRIPEAFLLGLGLMGGSPGGLLAMGLVRHKTRKWYFVWGMPLFLVLDLALLLYAHASGIV